MTQAKPPTGPVSDKGYLFFVAAVLFFLATAFQLFSAHHSHLRPIPGDPGMFWVMAALNGCLGVVFLIRGIIARNNAPRG